MDTKDAKSLKLEGIPEGLYEGQSDEESRNFGYRVNARDVFT